MTSRWMIYHCPETGKPMQLAVSANSLDEVQFRTLTIKNCGACGQAHKLDKADLALGDLAPEHDE